MEIPHPHDLKWYQQQLASLPWRLREKAAAGYRSAWEEAYSSEPAGHRKDNAARRAANTRLRIYVERINDHHS